MSPQPKLIPPTPNGPACPTCGEHHSMTLAEDKREYNKLAFEEGKWVRDGATKSVPTGENDSIRMFCTNCGEYFAPPEELCEL